MLLWPPGRDEKATKCHYVHKQQPLAANNHEEVARGKSELLKTNQGLIYKIQTGKPQIQRQLNAADAANYETRIVGAGDDLQVTRKQAYAIRGCDLYCDWWDLTPLSIFIYMHVENWRH